VPEGDSIHRVAARLQVLVGERVAAESVHPRGLATRVAAAVDGRVLEGVEAVGKHLLLHFEGGVTVRSHLRMGGRWRVAPVDAPLHGAPWLVLRGSAVRAAQWNGPVLTLDRRPLAGLGPDVLTSSFDPSRAAERVRGAGATPLGEALVDQSLVAGIGNRWMCEALWAAELSPFRPVCDTPPAEIERVLAWLARAMASGVAGERPARRAYRRAGRPCARCGETIESRGLGERNRTAYWCPSCQR
jgi:endonuclease-8